MDPQPVERDVEARAQADEEIDMGDAPERVWTDLIPRARGDGWKLTDKALEDLRTKKYPDLTAAIWRGAMRALLGVPAALIL
jgi:hypothetical protein